MDKYRKNLKMRIALLTIPVLLAVGLCIYDVFFASEAIKESFIFGFQCGGCTAIGLLSIVLIIRTRAILRDETKLKLQYNKEHDERLKAIRAKAGMPLLLITSIVMIIAGIIAGYFDSIMFYTLIAAALFQMLVGIIIKQIYLRKL